MEMLSTSSSSDSCQYVVVSFFLFQCVDAVACEQNLIKKQLELFSIKSFKRFMSICGCLTLSLSVCGCCCLSTEFNIETFWTVEHQILQATCLSMWWSNYFCFSVLNHPPVNRIKKGSDWNSWPLNHSDIQKTAWNSQHFSPYVLCHLHFSYI